MLQSPRGVAFNQENNIASKAYQCILFNKMIKQNQSYEDVIGKKYRLERTVPNMQQVIHTDMERMKTNKIYDRKLNQDLNGRKGLNWQCKQELQRLRSDERGVERDLVRLNRDLAKLSILPAISRSSSLSQNQTSRLSSIAEEHLSTPLFDRPKVMLQRSSSINSHRTPLKHLIPIPKASSIRKSHILNEQPHLLPKPNFQRLIAKTSDDRQQHAHFIEHQKRLVEQRLKLFLH